MSLLKFPVLYYALTETLYLGKLVGTEMAVLNKDLKGVKAGITENLQKDYKKYDYYPDVTMEDAKLRLLELEVRTAYKEDSGIYPLKDMIRISVPMVYGHWGESSQICYLPMQDDLYFYYEQEQLILLARYFAGAYYEKISPVELSRMVNYGMPQLDFVSLKVNAKPHFRKFSTPKDPGILEKLAERYPAPKAVRQRAATSPDVAWEMEECVRDTAEKLADYRSSILLAGNKGTGKSAVLRQAIRQLTAQPGRSGQTMTFWRLMPQRIVASARYLGEWQQVCDKLIQELQDQHGVLWIDDIIRLVELGGSGPVDSVAAYFVSFLQQGKLQIAGEVTPQELESLRRFIPSFTNCFQVIRLEEMPEAKVHLVLDHFSKHIRQVHKITLAKDALLLVYRLLVRYYPYESFPGKAINFLGKCIASAKENGAAVIGKEEVTDQFVKETGFPELFIRDEMSLEVAELTGYFNKRIIGQPKAVGVLTDIIKIFKAGLNNPGKPVSTLLFTGPTGVGKTEAAKALAGYFFGAGQKTTPLIRLDMSEFQYPDQIERFIGAGNRPGKLLQLIREKPFSVLLLDEVEKAHPAIFDALLTVFDEGFLTDAFGRITNFRNTIIIMTSNLGAGNTRAMGYASPDAQDDLPFLAAIQQFFRPEFINRIDGIVFFNPLSKGAIKAIAGKEMELLNQREGIIYKNITLKFSEKLLSFVAEKGFDEQYGARLLQRAIEEYVINPLTYWLLKNPAVKDCVLMLDYEERGETVRIVRQSDL